MLASLCCVAADSLPVITSQSPQPSPPRATATLRHWLKQAPFTLAMSSGFFGFYAHAGVLRVLEDEGLAPARGTGSSAGALVLGGFCAGMSAEQLCARLRDLQRRDFWDPGPGLGVLRGQRFAQLLDDMLPVQTFAECRIPLSISVFDVGRGTQVLDSGALAPAVRASCAVPLMFHPVRHQGRALYDGGIRDRPGLASAEPGERVFYHHLTSRLLGHRVPKRTGMVALELPSLAKADPFRLHNGRLAMDQASQAAKLALDLPVADVVRVHV